MPHSRPCEVWPAFCRRGMMEMAPTTRILVRQYLLRGRLMVKITLDEELRGKLNGLDEPVEVCDESGRTVGRFLPAAMYDDLWYAALAEKTGEPKEELR